MIWMIITKEEMEDGAQHVFRFNEEALGRDNIKLAIVEEDDGLNFVDEGDIIFSRTQNQKLLSTILRKKVKDTAENFELYKLVKDKYSLSSLMSRCGVLVPKMYNLAEVKDGKSYFIKPRYGHDSFGISKESICRTKKEVEAQVFNIERDFNQPAIVEDFIDGAEYTVSCVNNGSLHSYAIEIECKDGIQTYEGKDAFSEYCMPSLDSKLHIEAERIFNLLEVKHHARLDFRKGLDGRYYLIDVNLLPGLGPLAHYAKSLLLSDNISYVDALKILVNTAS